jgi:hypothetical protein
MGARGPQATPLSRKNRVILRRALRLKYPKASLREISRWTSISPQSLSQWLNHGGGITISSLGRLVSASGLRAADKERLLLDHAAGANSKRS